MSFKIHLLLGAIAVIAVVPTARADSIVKIPLAETNVPDVQYSGGVLSTVNDGDSTTSGDQDTRIEFVGPLSFLPNVNTPIASFSLENVDATGSASSGPVIVQDTTGGTFALYDQNNALLLSGVLSDGAITGGSADTGSFFNTSVATYTGGSLLAYINAMPAGISFALAGILSDGTTTGLVSTNNVLDPFMADSSGILTGSDVPEPASIALLLSGLAGAAKFRRNKAL